MKVTVDQHAAPAAAPAAPAEPESSVVTDATGRKLVIKQPSILQESRLVRAMGEGAMNAAYMTGYVLPAAMVVEVDGEAVPFPLTELQVDAAIQRVGRAGLSAVMQYITRSVNPEGDADAIKKSAGISDSERLAGS